MRDKDRLCKRQTSNWQVKYDMNASNVGVTEYIVHNKYGAGNGIKNYTSGCAQTLPCRIHIMDEYDEDDRSIDGTKRHHKIVVFCSIGPNKGQFVAR